MPAIAWFVMQRTIIGVQGAGSPLAMAIGRDLKGKLAPLAYLTGIGLAFVSTWLADAVYTGVALWWLVPDRRVEAALDAGGAAGSAGS